MSDVSLTKKNCDKCGARILTSRMMCWFTDDTMCNECIKKQAKYRERMRMAGMDDYEYMGCGYIPEIRDYLLED